MCLNLTIALRFPVQFLGYILIQVPERAARACYYRYTIPIPIHMRIRILISTHRILTEGYPKLRVIHLAAGGAGWTADVHLIPGAAGGPCGGIAGCGAGGTRIEGAKERA